MGAEWYETETAGATAGEAYTKACEQAWWDHGHSGYTGTIAEKNGFVQIPRPPRIKASKVAAVLYNAETYYWWQHHGANSSRVGMGYTEAPYGKEAFEACKQWWPAGSDIDYVKIFTLLDEKWEASLVVEQDLATRKKDFPNLPKGHKTFLFFGRAST